MYFIWLYWASVVFGCIHICVVLVGEDWIVYCICAMLVYGCGQVFVTVCVVTLWMNACACACTCLASRLNRSAVLLLAIYMHALVLTLVHVASIPGSDELTQ